MGTIYVKPAEGYKIHDPELLDYIPAEGRLVNESDYWHRRLRDKDVTLEEAPAAADPAPKKK